MHYSVFSSFIANEIFIKEVVVSARFSAVVSARFSAVHFKQVQIIHFSRQGLLN